MKRRPSKSTLAMAALAASSVLYGAKAAAFIDLGGDAILADLLANSVQQLAKADESVSQLRRSYGEMKKVAEYADDAATAAQSFQHFSTARFGTRFTQDLDGAAPDVEYYRQDLLGQKGMGNSSWAQGTGTLQRLSTYCLTDVVNEKPACVKLRAELESAKVLHALDGTFGPGAATRAAQAGAVDAEVAATVKADAAQGRLAEMQKLRLRALLARCNQASEVGDAREAKRLAEECSMAAQQAQVLHLEEGQETNAKLTQLARLQALAVEQKNADLKRELAESQGRREALTAGLEAVASQRVSIRSGGLGL